MELIRWKWTLVTRIKFNREADLIIMIRNMRLALCRFVRGAWRAYGAR